MQILWFIFLNEMDIGLRFSKEENKMSFEEFDITDCFNISKKTKDKDDEAAAKEEKFSEPRDYLQLETEKES